MQQRSHILRRLLHEARPYYPRLFLSLVLGAIAGTGVVAFAPAFELLVKYVINSPQHNVHLLWLIVCGLFLVNLLSNGAGYGSSYLTAWSGQRLIADLRVRLFAHALRLPLLSYDAWRPGELLARFTNDLSLMTDAMSIALPQLVQVVITFVISLAYMLYTDWFLTLVLLVVAPVVSFAVARFTGLIAVGTMHTQGRIAELTTNLSEVLHAQRIVKAFCREEYETKRFVGSNERFFGAYLKLTQLGLTQTPVVGMIIVVTLLAIVVISAHEVIVGRMDSGSVFRFWTLVALSINPMNRIASYLGDLSRGLIGAERIYEILDIPQEMDHPEVVRLSTIEGTLVFDNVRFAYPGSTVPVLDGLHAVFASGTVVALVGPSGAGKTTIANLVPRFYDIEAGRITLDGIDLARLSLAQLREAIGIVPQESQLFQGSIAENIRYGCLQATDEMIERAAREANAHEFIHLLPDGYNTLVGERGMRLSGGQRQRIAIARAIVRNPRILILDEATSALDSHSERLIEEALDVVLRGRTTIIIAHRLSTIRRADTILYIEGGRIVEAGSHQELLALGSLYAALFSAQHT